MLVIRLNRIGRKNLANYRIVAAEKSKAPGGKYVAKLGHYNPHTKELVVDKALAEQYLGNGAQPSSTVVKLFKQAQVKLPAWAEANLKVKQRPPKSKGEAEAAKQPTAKTETATDASDTETAAAKPQDTADQEAATDKQEQPATKKDEAQAAADTEQDKADDSAEKAKATKADAPAAGEAAEDKATPQSETKADDSATPDKG